MSLAPAYQPRTLADHGIDLPRHPPGVHRMACPRCAQAPRARDQALAVTIHDDGHAVWYCHRCGFSGAVPSPDERARMLWRGPDSLISAKLERELPGTVEHMHPRLSNEGRALWGSGREITAGTPAHRYLTQARGLDLTKAHGLTAALRWLPDLAHPCGHRGPGLIALVTDAVTGDPINLHRTWLKADGDGKAALDTPRRLLKGHPKKRGVIRLAEDAEIHTALGVAEGLETALSAITIGVPTWACIDAGNLARFPVLDGIETLWVFADCDPTGIKAAEACAEAWSAEGREVRTYTPATPGYDLNDELRQGASRC